MEPPAPPSSPSIETAASWTQVISNLLLFILVASFSAATDFSLAASRRKQLCRGVGIAMGLQFVMLPFVGFCTARIFALDRVYGVMLQVVTSCPGGAYSNWWCSLFNADLLLSVTATAVATIMSAALLPFNLWLYLSVVYQVDAIDGLRFDLLMVTVGVVISAVICGAIVSTRVSRIPFVHHAQRVRDRCALLGNMAGVCLVVFSFIFLSVSEPIWDREAPFYGATAIPPLVAVCASMVIGSIPALRLSKPERVAVAIECTFQNVGIGLAAALTLFESEEAARAAGVPIFYGVVQTTIIPISLVAAWKAGWTYASPSTPLCTVLRDSHQPSTARPGRLAAVDASASELTTSSSL